MILQNKDLIKIKNVSSNNFVVLCKIRLLPKNSKVKLIKYSWSVLFAFHKCGQGKGRNRLDKVHEKYLSPGMLFNCFSSAC